MRRRVEPQVTRRAAPKVVAAPLGGSEPRSGGAWGLPFLQAYFSRIRVERSTSRKVSTSEADSETASMTVQAIMR